MVLKEEYGRLGELLAQAPASPVLINKSIFAAESEQDRDPGLRRLVALLKEDYELAATTKGSYLFARKEGRVSNWALKLDACAEADGGVREKRP